MTEADLNNDRWISQGNCVLDAETGCRVITNAIEEVRQALHGQSQALLSANELWRRESPFDFLKVLDANYECFETSSYVGMGIWNLLEHARRLINLTYNKTAVAGHQAVPNEVFIRFAIPSARLGFGFNVPKDPRVITREVWPFWLEAVRRMPDGYFPCFHSIRGQTDEFLHASSCVYHHLEKGIALRKTKSGIFEKCSDAELEFEIRQCMFIQSALPILEDSVLKIGRNIQIIAQAVFEIDKSFFDCGRLVSELDQNVGFQHIGRRLIDYLANRYHSGDFSIKSQELKKAIGASHNAFVSVLPELKAQQVLVGIGFQDKEELWSMPSVCSLQAYFNGRNLPREPQERAVQNEPPPATSDLLVQNGIRVNSVSDQTGGSVIMLAGLEQLLKFATTRLTDSQKVAIEFVVEHGGKAPLVDLAFHMKWEEPFKDCWNGLRTRINEAIRNHNRLPAAKREGVAKVSLAITRSANHAVLVPLKSISRGKKLGSMKRASPLKRLKK